MSTQRPRGPAPAAPRTPRTLADELRARGDEELARLLESRPDLLSPVPGDLSRLATRAGTRASVLRAVERLDGFALQVAEALAVAPDPCPLSDLRSLLVGEGEPLLGPPEEPGYEPAAVTARLPYALGELRSRALVWGEDERLRLVRTAREVLAPAHGSPTGLGPPLAEAGSGASPGGLQEILATLGLPATPDPAGAWEALTAHLGGPDGLPALLDSAPEGVREALERLVWGPPFGTVNLERPSPPVTWLLERGLLLPSGPGTVVLPREVALRLRGGRAHRRPRPVPPTVTERRAHDPKVVDETAAAQAATALATVTDLLTAWESEPPPVLRAGGLGVRELRRTALVLDLPESATAFWIELAYGAGLLAPDGEVEERYAPTPAYDAWLERPDPERWTRLVAAWLAATRVPALVGHRDGRGRALAALGSGLDRGQAPDLRLRTLRALALPPEGSAPERDSVLARLDWESPLRGAGPAEGAGTQERPDPDDTLRRLVARATLDEAEALGLTGRGALSSPGRALALDGRPPSGREDPGLGWGRTAEETGAALERAAALLAPSLPRPVDHVLLQADLTAVAPGPLERPLAETLSVLADVESKGGATVYRFTPASVRRALDQGRTAAELHSFLAAHSPTPVPQPLGYLIDDVARRHGQLRVGALSSYVRCEDEALLSEILADRRTAPLRPRMLAPTVLGCAVPPDQLLERLRELGYAPTAESSEGATLLSRAPTRRTPARTPPEPAPDGPPTPDATLLASAVRAIRAGDHAVTAEHRPTPAPTQLPESRPPRTHSARTLELMRSAALEGTVVWIGYVNADGAASQRVIAPVRVEGGFVTGYDHTVDEMRTYPLHRITGAAELAED
ncbi:helicase-associated domain-containing protein [Streptomyces sp. NPDC005438]|uniref:helicase-associated domain-containing protein n=1 Tax=Streptomyces sp. NPDC005438 TaxID=3156880 RepID=UPI0033B46679